MNSIILNMNDILTHWKEQYDLFSAVSFSFSDVNGALCFNGLPLCQADAVTELLSADFSAEEIQFFLNDRRSILVTIDWPEDKPPVISSVCLIFLLASPEVFGIE